MVKDMDQKVIPLLKKIGLEVRRFREQCNHTDEELEKRLGMSIDKVKRIEEGKVNILLSELVTIQKEVSFPWEIMKQP
jgi:transcriptional regulator with XRE-family HTH domain